MLNKLTNTQLQRLENNCYDRLVAANTGGLSFGMDERTLRLNGHGALFDALRLVRWEQDQRSI